MNEVLQALYLHIPFCVRKCSYCDFYSLPPTDPDIMQQYTLRLAEVIRLWGEALPEAELDTVYLGGGTPSLLSEKMMDTLMEALYQYWRLTPEVEISMEANPATMTLKKAQSFRRAGINRISLGVQSFQPEELQCLARLHGVQEVLETVERIRWAGFDRYNLDFIYGIPGQTLESWENTLTRALQLQPEHLSLYLLQMDEAVPLYRQIERGEKTEPEENSVVEMFYLADALLRQQGYVHYEISNFARPGKECRHNLHYWRSHPYLGLGAGAVSLLSGKRFQLSPDVLSFLRGDSKPHQGWGEVLEEMDTPRLRLSDMLIMGLRLMEGLKEAELIQRFGQEAFSGYENEIAQCEAEGLLEKKDGYIRLTRRGWFLSNQVFWRLV